MSNEFSDKLIKIATFNIRYSPNQLNANNAIRAVSGISTGATRCKLSHPSGINIGGEAPWEERLPLILDQIEWEAPDIVGFQEALDHQYCDLRNQLSGYTSAGVGRDDGARKGEYVPLCWRTDRFRALGIQHFWLSEQPDVIGSIGWDAGQTRMATVVNLEPIHPSVSDADQSFYVMNTHFDDRGLRARTESAKLILSKANDLMVEKQRPIILMGDLNGTRQEEAYQILTGQASSTNLPSLTDHTACRFFKDCGAAIERPFGSFESTFTGFTENPNDAPAQVIDFLMVMSAVKVDQTWKTIRYGVIPNQFNRQPYASDHRLVCALINTGP